jgi:predicted dehydrogenase
MSLWLIGAGQHAREYSKVLNDLDVEYKVIGRNLDSANKFKHIMGRSVHTGGLANALAMMEPPNTAIVAVSFDQLAEVATNLIEAGTKRILLEKPGGLSIAQLERVQKVANLHCTQVLIAYNRRFYASTTKARELIAADGGPLSCSFEFTEWAHNIEPMSLSAEVKSSWLIANSSHVIDLAFHLCGLPKEWKYWHDGNLNWHPAASRFCGAGITDQGVLFSYLADWQAPGRWSLDVLTRKRRLIFKPMEQLQSTMLASVNTEFLEIDDLIDREYKPGIYKETKAFLAEEDGLFCTIADQLRNGVIYSEMAGYSR